MIRHFIHQLLRLFYPTVKRVLPFQVYAYLVLGAANTLLNIALFWIFFYVFSTTSWAVEIAVLLSFGLTLVTGFWLQANFAFTHAATEKQQRKKQFIRYAYVAVQGQFCAYLITRGFVSLLHMDPRMAYMITTAIMLLVNFLFQKYFAFAVKKVSVN